MWLTAWTLELVRLGSDLASVTYYLHDHGLSVPQFLHLYNGNNNNSTYPRMSL